MNVVITGVTKGIGRAIAHTFAEGGNNIAGCARTVKDVNDMQAAFIARYGENSFSGKATDVSNEGEIKDFAQWLADKNLLPDILVNNAGYFLPGSIHLEQERTLQNMMEVNVYAAYHLTRAVLPAMIERGSGHIFNICSIASVVGFENVGAYGISKFAMLGFSKNLREEMKPYGIKVTAVCPGATYSASWQESAVDPKRIMEASDVAAMVFAASRLSPQAVVEDIIMRPQQGDL